MANRGVNKVILIGNLGQEPEVRHIPNGGIVVNLALATKESWRDKQTGEMKEKTEWHRVVLFNKVAEIASEYLHKGSQIYIEGSLQTRKWQDVNGQERYTTEVIVNMNGTLQMLGYRQHITNNNQNTTNNSLLSKQNDNHTEMKSSQLNHDNNLDMHHNLADDFDDIPF